MYLTLYYTGTYEKYIIKYVYVRLTPILHRCAQDSRKLLK